MAEKNQGDDQENKITLDYYRDVSLLVTVELGRTSMSVRNILGLTPGTVVEIEKLAGEPVDIRVNNKPMARGEVVVVNDKFGVRVTEILSPDSLDEQFLGGK